MQKNKNVSLSTSDSNSLAIEVTDVEHAYAGVHPQLKFSRWSVKAGEQVFLYGNSGSGKSTLLNLLSGILSSQSGSIRLFGNDITTLSNRARDQFRAKNIGVVFQQFNLIPYLSVLENIELAAFLGKTRNQETVARIESLVSSLQLPQRALHVPVSSLSIGQQQRVAIIRAFINSPKLLLIDEPTSALDDSAKHAFMTHLKDICERQATTMIFVSHDSALKSFFSVHTPISSFCSVVTAQEPV